MKNKDLQVVSGMIAHSESEAKGRARERDPGHIVGEFSAGEDLTLRGRYMSVTVRQTILNIRLKEAYHEHVRDFTLVNAIWENIWDYRLSVDVQRVTLIDSDGFQHGSSFYEYSSFTKLLGTDGTYTDVSYPWPDLVLEDHAKTAGWLWFDPLPEGAFPRRFVFSVDVFDPGNTSGLLRDTEKLEIICR